MQADGQGALWTNQERTQAKHIARFEGIVEAIESIDGSAECAGREG